MLYLHADDEQFFVRTSQGHEPDRCKADCTEYRLTEVETEPVSLETEPRPDTIPGRLRATADWLDALDRLGRSIVWEDDHQLTNSVTEAFTGTDMQEDLRADADTIEALLADTNHESE